MTSFVYITRITYPKLQVLFICEVHKLNVFLMGSVRSDFVTPFVLPYVVS